MPKAPASQFYWNDYYRDTRVLTPPARGIWMDMLCGLHFSETRGRLTLSTGDWIRQCACTEKDLLMTIEEINRKKISTIKRKPNGDLTVISRRMLREEKDKENNRKRQSDWYDRNRPNGNLTPNLTASSRQPNNALNLHSSSSSSKKEKNPLSFSPCEKRGRIADRTTKGLERAVDPAETKARETLERLGIHLPEGQA